jgi:hypothetical protein
MGERNEIGFLSVDKSINEKNSINFSKFFIKPKIV